ncbi:DUF2258 domain-containing protein [Desulfurococcaceae archaeon MEX13E-LK6-19]|nr:DUF2258 domain-containing protein [Desulfurococcaceae archaeon MEX13E-LK6-19]
MPKELSTGLVIAGAYADKLRRTLFAQLRDLVKQNKEFAREIARASGEINRLIYIVLVEKLKADKGDVVRIRVQYDVEDGRIKWYYDTLRIEYFKRVPDEQVAKIVKETIDEKLKEIQEQYAVAPSQEEAEAMMRGEKVEKVEKEEVTEAKPEEAKVEEKPAVEEKPPEIDLKEVIAEAAPVGETMEGGVVFEIKNSSGENIGVASIEARGGAYIAEAVILPKPGEAYKIYIKLSGSLEDYRNDPNKLVDELVKAKPVKISADEARSILQSKMESLV